MEYFLNPSHGSPCRKFFGSHAGRLFENLTEILFVAVADHARDLVYAEPALGKQLLCLQDPVIREVFVEGFAEAVFKYMHEVAFGT